MQNKNATVVAVQLARHLRVKHADLVGRKVELLIFLVTALLSQEIPEQLRIAIEDRSTSTHRVHEDNARSGWREEKLVLEIYQNPY